MINWQKLEEEFNNFKPQAPEGTYKAKVSKVEVKKLPSGSIAVTFKFENSKDYSFPWSTHWVSMDNKGWTAWHHRCLLEAMGINKDNAKKALENIIDDDKPMPSADELVSSFQKMYDRLAAKKPEVEIVVRPQVDQNGEFRYSKKGYQQFESEFTDSRVFSAQKTKQAGAETVSEEAPAEDLTEDDLSSIPF